jgi:O-antigen/teichoic acid export membrane protein
MKILFISSLWRGFISKGHERTIQAKKNIAASIVIKGLNVAIGLVLVPLTIHYLDPTKYGIWITLSSIIGWFGFFDIGIGHGLRNRFAEALAVGKDELAKIYVSTTYAVLSIIIVTILFLFYLINPFLNWEKLLNIGDELALRQELNILILVVFTFFCLQFVFKLITTILQADQRPALASSYDLLSKIFVLVIIFILTKTTNGSLLYLGICMSGVPFFVLVISNIFFYSGKYSSYRPSWNSVDFCKVKDLLTLGIKFFIIQIAAVLLYQTNNIIISHLFGPAEVTPYNIVFKYFSILTMGFTILLTPFWSAFTEAWVKNDLSWIKKAMRKLIQLWAILLFCGIIMAIVSPWVYPFWVGNEIVISSKMSLLVAAWVILNAWNGIFSYFLNGVGIIKLQVYQGVGGAILNIPLAIYLGLKIGIEGVLLANIIVISSGILIYPIQYKKIINGNAKGIWSH